MSQPAWTLTDAERATLGAALDALLPPEGNFPLPSQTGLIDDFILRRIPAPGTDPIPYPGLDADGLRAILARLAGTADATDALAALEQDYPANFLALWRLAVYAYYSRPETIDAISSDLAPAYHGAPLPLGYAHAIALWDPADPLQNPQHRRGGYTQTEDVRRIDLGDLADTAERQ